MTVACSTASFRCCVQVHHGVTFRRTTVPAPPVTTASFGGGVRASGTRSWNALAAGHDAAVQMIDTSVVRVHQHGACVADNNQQDMGRSRGGLTSKIHAVVDTNGLPVRLALTPGEAHDNRLCSALLSALPPQTMLLADRGYDAVWIRERARQQGAWANIPPKRNRKESICFSPYLYRARNLIERYPTRSSHVGVSRPDTTNLRPTIWRLSNSHQFAVGCVLMSPRPSTTLAGFDHG